MKTIETFWENKIIETLPSIIENRDKTRLHKLSPTNNTYFGAIHYDIHVDLKIDYTITRNVL